MAGANKTMICDIYDDSPKIYILPKEWPKYMPQRLMWADSAEYWTMEEFGTNNGAEGWTKECANDR